MYVLLFYQISVALKCFGPYIARRIESEAQMSINLSTSRISVSQWNWTSARCAEKGVRVHFPVRTFNSLTSLFV
jgi:hypothetical protein